MAPRTEAALLESARSGDIDARGELLECHRQDMFRLACKTLGRSKECDAQEMVQDAFVKALDKFDTFKGDSKFSTWLYRVTYNTCRDCLRTHRPRTNDLEIDDPTVPETKWLPELVTNIVTVATRQRQLGDIYKKALRQLQDEEKTVLLLHVYKELTVSEIAARLEWPLGTVKTRLRNGRMKMRNLVIHYGLTAEA